MKAIIVASVIFCAALIGLGYYFASREDSGGPRLIPVNSSYEERVSKGFWHKGSEQPKVTLVEYGDFQCPACRAEYQIINQAVEATKDFVQLQYHQYPLPSHNKARTAAKGAEAAGRQGKFWEMHELLYARQLSWSEQVVSQFESTLETYAQDLQLNVEQFKKDMRDGGIIDEVDKDIQKGNEVPVTGTPTLVINGKVVTNLPTTPEELIKMLQDANTALQP